ncbi:MAG: U32 family peptidase [Clostridia bacterium]|nr:U32 family peptidase [Clostridia bacterium]
MDQINFFRKRPEILAPVGGEEQLKAAVRCGADAVYFGLPNFNARRNADNFAGAGLKATIFYCHDADVKVYVTINTLVMDDELSGVHEAVDTAARSGADGIIVQDLAVASYAKRHWPGLPLLASTQMAVCNADGVRKLLEYGFSRVVLARELSISEIREIISETGADCEVFVHGAHCMSVSGNCYMSAMFGGRSGNRGLCAQPCRLDWRIRGRDHALSLKDMCYIPRIEELAEAGVSSLKIEGRMKRPEYVAAAVTACRQALSGAAPDIETLRAVFSRSGFTDGYLAGKRTLDMFGYRTKEDVTAASGVLEDLASMIRNTPDAKLPVEFFLEAREGQPARLAASCGDAKAESFGPVPAAAMRLALDDAQAKRSLLKTGGSSYEVWRVKCAIDPGLYLPASALNAMRREALEALDIERNRAYARKRKDAPDDPLPAYAPSERSSLRLRFEKAAQIPDVPEDAVVILPVKEIANAPELADRFAGRLCAELPPLIYGAADAEKIRSLLRGLPKSVRDAACSNIGSVRLAQEAGFRVHGGFELNVLNSAALEECRAMGLADAILSPELAFAKMRRMRGELPRGALVYGYLPLMKCRACPGKTEKGCGNCSGLASLTDRTGAEFPLICREKKYAEILNCVPLYAGDRSRPRLDFEELYFTIETKERCGEVLALYLAGLPLDAPRTAGLYFRELL